jgi:hypothetical protein
VTSKAAIRQVCKANATGSNRKQRRANEIIAYKKVLKYLKRGTMNPGATSMDAGKIIGPKGQEPVETEGV